MHVTSRLFSPNRFTNKRAERVKVRYVVQRITKTLHQNPQITPLLKGLQTQTEEIFRTIEPVTEEV